MSFTLEQLIAIFGLGCTMVGAIWIVFNKVTSRIEALDAEMSSRFTGMENAASERFDKAEVAREALRADVSTRRHELAGKMQDGLNEVHARIDEVKDQYARREDVLALTASMNSLGSVVTSLGNVVSRFEGMLTPLLTQIPRA